MVQFRLLVARQKETIPFGVHLMKRRFFSGMVIII